MRTKPRWVAFVCLCLALGSQWHVQPPKSFRLATPVLFARGMKKKIHLFHLHHVVLSISDNLISDYLAFATSGGFSLHTHNHKPPTAHYRTPFHQRRLRSAGVRKQSSYDTHSFRKLSIAQLPALQPRNVEAITPSFVYDGHPKEKPRTRCIATANIE